jgi:hypothetical protein
MKVLMCVSSTIFPYVQLNQKWSTYMASAHAISQNTLNFPIWTTNIYKLYSFDDNYTTSPLFL